DQAALVSLLAYGAVQGPRTIARGILLLDPGHYATLDLNGHAFEARRLVATRYWDFPTPRAGAETSGNHGEELRALLRSAVRSHLISDVPVGVFLSSGLDSTAVAVLCAESGIAAVDTFTVALGDMPELDENPEATRTAERLGACHHAIHL